VLARKSQQMLNVEFCMLNERVNERDVFFSGGGLAAGYEKF